MPKLPMHSVETRGKYAFCHMHYILLNMNDIFRKKKTYTSNQNSDVDSTLELSSVISVIVHTFLYLCCSLW